LTEFNAYKINFSKKLFKLYIGSQQKNKGDAYNEDDTHIVQNKDGQNHDNYDIRKYLLTISFIEHN
jgi:hypothetical protein